MGWSISSIISSGGVAFLTVAGKDGDDQQWALGSNLYEGQGWVSVPYKPAVATPCLATLESHKEVSVYPVV